MDSKSDNSISTANKMCLELSSDLLDRIQFLKQSESDNHSKSSLQPGDYENEGVDLIDPEESSFSYGYFFEKYLIGNRPCVFTENVSKDWNSRKEWTQRSSEGILGINFEYLLREYGNQTVSVTNCDKMLSEYGDSSSCESMTVAEFITYWRKYQTENYPASMPCLYLKDWHIMKNWTKVEKPYITPAYFASDWLNESCEGTCDDFKFTYMGPKGSWTPFHADVYGSFSWSANVIGTKKWHLYPPGREAIFKNPKAGKIEYNFQNPGIKDVDYYEVLQETGQVIFVPSGWHHIVWNLADTISINHNWMNAANIKFIWTTLMSALDDVVRELDDLKDADDFQGICQGLLKANHGMNYSDFLDILFKIRQNRHVSHFVVDDSYYFGPNHTQFDVQCIKSAVEFVEEDSRYTRAESQNSVH